MEQIQPDTKRWTYLKILRGCICGCWRKNNYQYLQDFVPYMSILQSNKMKEFKDKTKLFANRLIHFGVLLSVV